MNHLTELIKPMCLFLIPGLLVACSDGGNTSNGNSTPPSTPTPSAFVYVVNKGNPLISTGGRVSALTVTNDTGRLSSVPGSPFAGPLAPVSIATNPSHTLLYVLNESLPLRVYHINENGSLTLLVDHDLRALVPPSTILGTLSSLRLHPNGRWLYIRNDRVSSSSILVFSVVPQGPDAGKVDRFMQELPVTGASEFAISGNFLFIPFPLQIRFAWRE